MMAVAAVEPYDMYKQHMEYCGLNALNNIFKNYPRTHDMFTMDFIRSDDVMAHILNVTIPAGHVHVGSKGALHINVMNHLVSRYTGHNFKRISERSMANIVVYYTKQQMKLKEKNSLSAGELEDLKYLEGLEGGWNSEKGALKVGYLWELYLIYLAATCGKGRYLVYC